MKKNHHKKGAACKAASEQPKHLQIHLVLHLGHLHQQATTIRENKSPSKPVVATKVPAWVKLRPDVLKTTPDHLSAREAAKVFMKNFQEKETKESFVRQLKGAVKAVSTKPVLPVVKNTNQEKSALVKRDAFRTSVKAVKPHFGLLSTNNSNAQAKKEVPALMKRDANTVKS